MSQEHHFYAACCFGWTTDLTEALTLKRLAVAFGFDAPDDQDVNVLLYRVAQPPEATYDIRGFLPDVDDSLLQFVKDYTMSAITELYLD